MTSTTATTNDLNAGNRNRAQIHTPISLLRILSIASDDEDEEEDEDKGDVDSDAEPESQMNLNSRKEYSSRPTSVNDNSRPGQQSQRSSDSGGMGQGMDGQQFSHLRPPRTLPQIPGHMGRFHICYEVISVTNMFSCSQVKTTIQCRHLVERPSNIRKLPEAHISMSSHTVCPIKSRVKME